MYLKSLEITGFKSFAKKTVLEFSTPITGIVGPNGSGKSNAAEAFRFVLGEQSMKSLRGKRGEDLIFNGGVATSRLNRAAVKLVFDNSSRALAVDFDEVAIERVVHRDSANEYFINGSPSRLRDIVELLSGAHIGASGHHIISQGEADRILNANLKERREMIEDALGLKIYQYKREESERKLEKTGENIKQVQTVRREIAPHLRFLEKQMEKVEKTEKLRGELAERSLEYFKRESIYVAVHQARLNEEQRHPNERKTALEHELAAAKKILEKAAAERKDAKTDLLVSLEKKMTAVRAERDEASRQAGRLEGEIASEERNLRRQETMAASLDARTVPLSAIEEAFSAVEQKVSEAETAGDPGLFKKICASVKELLKDFLNRYRGTVSGVAADQNQNIQAEIERLTAERHSIIQKITAIDEAERGLVADIERLRTDIEKEKDSNRDAEKAVFRIMAELNEVVSTLAGLKNRHDILAITETAFKRDLGEVGALVGRAVLDFAQYSFGEHSGHGATLSDDDIANEPRIKQEDRRKGIERLKIRIEEAGAAGGDDIVKEYTEAKERDAFLEREIADLEKSAEILKTLISDLEQKLDTEFKTGVAKINQEFGAFFTLMFGGGAAHLDVVRAPVRAKRGAGASGTAGILDDEDGAENSAHSMTASLDSTLAGETEEPEEGIDIAVSLPKKRIKGLAMLSGGERALTSIALLFAISQVNPPPFIILDETDAALDEANSRKYGDMVENLSKHSQLILITHNRETMSRAGVLYGVTMGAEGASKLLSVKFDEAVAVAK